MLRLLRDRVWTPAREAVEAWYDDSAPRWSAAIAFYTIFSLAPVLIIVTAVAGALWGDQAVRAEVLGQFRELLGERGAWVYVRTRLLSFAVVLCMSFLLAASLVVNAGLSALGDWMGERLPAPVPVLRLVETAVTFGVLWLLFAVIFRWLPDARIAWKDVWIGAAVTAALFSAGKLGIGLYLGRAGVASAYGVAGSVVLILLWVYYSAMVFLLGAEFTEVYSRRWGSHIRPVDVSKPHPADGFSAPRDKTGL